MRILAMTAAVMLASGAAAQAPAPKTIKMQSTWPASNTLQEHFKMFGERLDKLTQGGIKVEAMPAGQIVPAFEVLDATHKKVLDGWHSISYYWVGKNPAAALFAAPPGGPFGPPGGRFGPPGGPAGRSRPCRPKGAWRG